MGLASPGVAQNTIAVFPCRVKPAANQDCNALPKGEAPTPPGSTPSPVIGVNDYYDVYIESVCIDQPDSWWKNKLVNLSATVSVGKNLIKVPAYQDRTGSQCRIGLANFPLVTSVPANGQSLGLAASILRSDKNDGLQKLLSFMTGEQKSTELSTYAAAAVPYVTAISNLCQPDLRCFRGTHNDVAEHEVDGTNATIRCSTWQIRLKRRVHSAIRRSGFPSGSRNLRGWQ